MKFNSIAMIETSGLVSAITALDVMLKLGEIKYLKKEIISNGYVTVFVEGNTPELKRILQAGNIAANNVGNVISSSIIENPDKLLYELILDKKPKNGAQLPKVKNKIKKFESEKILTLFDNEEKLNSPNLSISSYEPQILVEESEKTFKNDIFLDTHQNEVHESVPIDSQKIDVSELVQEETLEAEVSESEKEEIQDKEVLEMEKEEVLEAEVSESEKEEIQGEEVEEMEKEEVPEPEVSESEKEEIQGEEVEEMEKEEVLEAEVSESEKEEIQDEEVVEMEKEEVLEAEVSESEKEEIQGEEVVEMEKKDFKSEKEDSNKNEENAIINLSHLERLRLEAKLEIEKENKVSNYQNIIPQKEVNTKKFSEMNVHELRKLARGNVNFPIKGREISKANRSILINYFNDIS